MCRVHKLPAEERLLVLLNLARLTEHKLDAIRKVALSPKLSWAKVHELAEINAVLPLSFYRLKALGCTAAIPADILGHWEYKATEIHERGLRRAEWVKRMLEAMRSFGIEVIVLKGALFGDAIYGNPSYKQMNDVDILIRPADALRAVDVLKGMGFRGVGALFGRKEVSFKRHHTPPFVSPDLACVVGLHWGLVSPLSPWRPDTAAIWKRKVPVRVAGIDVFRMTWEDNLLHLCVHLPFFKTGLRELADVYNLVFQADEGIDWDCFARRARRWKAGDAVYRVLALTDALVDLRIPPNLWEEWQANASKLTFKDTHHRLSRPASILRSRSTYVARIEKEYVIFALTENYSERLQAFAGMWALMLWPREDELKRITGREEISRSRAAWLSARVSAPGRLWNAMAREHGHLALAAMTAANAALLAQASVRRALNPRVVGQSLRDHPAALLLEVLE